MGCCAPCPQCHTLQGGTDQWGAEEAEVTPSTATGSPMLSSCTYRPTPTQETGGCWEAQAPTHHHFLLSLWCGARPGQGDSGVPQDIQVAQVQKEKQAGTAWPRGHASAPAALSNHLGAPRTQIPVNSHGRGRGAQPCHQGPAEPLVRPSPVIRSSPAKTALQTDSIGTVAHGWSDGTGHPTVALHGTPAHLCPPTLAALQAGSVEMENIDNGEVKKDMEEEDEEEVEKDDSEDTKEMKVEDVEVDMEEDLEEKEEELEKDEKEMKDVDVEELEDAHGTDKAAQPDGAGGSGMSPLSTGTRCMLGSLSLVPRQPGGTEESLQALVSQLRAELGQHEAAAQALAVRLAQAELRHQQQEEDSAQRAQLWAREAEALRETNTFLQRALEAAVAAGDPGALARAQEEARGWQEVAEEQGTRLAKALAEAAVLTSRLQECQEALVAAGQTDMLKDAGTSNEVAAVEKVLQQALEFACGPQEPPAAPQTEEEPSTVTSMAMRLASLAATAQEENWQSRQQLQAQQQEMARLQEELSRARQDGERWASALQRAQREALEREATRGAEQARQQELIRDMKERLLELLREKDALWQKTEGIDTPMPSPVPRDPGLCARCRKDFRLLSRRYSCRLCQGKVCHTCSVDMGKHGRCCLVCYQQGQPQAT
uniref:RUN and FYVE domain containing 4 n=1 Tax=Cyanistes caeruleus TaxID=156563 RepID=A0A8C0VSR2_CYACU